MSPRGLVPAFAALALVLAVPAYAHTYEFDTVPDAAGDGDPDITRVVAGSNSTGAITFVVGIGNRTELAATELVQVLIDADNNPATGQPPNGVEYELEMDAQDVKLMHWSGSSFDRVASQTAYGYIYNGFRMSVNKSNTCMWLDDVLLVERLAVGAIADGMDGELVAVLHREPRGLFDLDDLGRLEPLRLRLVRVRRQQPGAARAERAVDRLLDRADGEVAVAVADHLVLRELRRDRLVSLPHHHPQAHADLPFVDHLLHAIDGRRDPNRRPGKW